MALRFQALATDYDGTLARHGRVDQATLDALERVRDSGRHLFMVTGREIPDLERVFARVDLFELIVGENGAVLYYPATERLEVLGTPPPPQFMMELEARGITPLSAGEVIVASHEPHQAEILEVIRELGLELEIIFNKGSVMVLPTGINKATGLAAGLRAAGLRPESTVGIGDAENDHAFLRLCGCGVAVSNALPSLKAAADYVTHHSQGEGVAELADLLVKTDLADIAPPPVPSTAHAAAEGTER